MSLTDSELGYIASNLGAALLARGWKVACAESCTGGWIAKTLTDIPGSSAWFGWGLVTYANDSKLCILYTSPSQRDALLDRMPSSA